MHNDKVIDAQPVFAGWRIIRSDAGRLWASRETPFPAEAEEAGAYRTVDADDLRALAATVAEQERLARQATP